jgi:serine/threonine protein kinase
MTSHPKHLARLLTGLILPGGWRVLAPLAVAPAPPGGISWQGYLVESADGVRAFLKALDYSAAFPNQELTPRALQAMTSAYLYERDLLLRCSDRGLSRVVTALGSGNVRFADGPPPNVVEYLIFELADGDLARMAELGERFDVAWALRALHHLATGVRELHRLGIAHQDLKPENLLLFGGALKLADLGRAARRGTSGPFDHLEIPGDWGYAPPELLYGHVDADWDHRHLGCDAYLLGSMAVFFFTGSSMTALWTAQLETRHLWQLWLGTFDQVMPYLRPAFDRAIAELTAQVPRELAPALETMVRQLCEPDPRRRGHPRERTALFGNPFNLDRYVAKLDLLAKRAEAGLRKA